MALESTQHDTHDEENRTVYDSLTRHPQSALFLTVLNEYPDLISELQNHNKTHTVWAPTNAAVELFIAKSTDKSKENIEHILRHLISANELPTRVLFHVPNVQTLFCPPHLNGQQLIRTRPCFHKDVGPTYSVNFEATIIEADIILSNGVMHIIDSVPTLPTTMSRTIADLPEKSFSLLHRAMACSDFKFHAEDSSFRGGTFFAPTNAAFQAHGAEILSSLFQVQQRHQLRELLERHFSPGETLYSNLLYRETSIAPASRDATPSSVGSDSKAAKRPEPEGKASHEGKADPPVRNGTRTFTLASALQGQTIVVKIERLGGLIKMLINENGNVVSADHLASDGVVHIVDALVPTNGDLLSEGSLS